MEDTKGIWKLSAILYSGLNTRLERNDVEGNSGEIQIKSIVY